MTLQEIKLLHAYNSWATNRIFEAVTELPPGQVMQEMKSSHGSIYGTLLHILGAEKIWLSRWTGTPDATMITSADAPTLGELKMLWEKVGYEIAKFLGSMTDKKLQDTFTMITSKGETYTHIYWQAFQHLVDHGTYHRGQIVTLLRQLGVKPPSTGMIMFYRETGKIRKPS